jgi:hypothetical protein
MLFSFRLRIAAPLQLATCSALYTAMQPLACTAKLDPLFAAAARRLCWRLQGLQQLLLTMSAAAAPAAARSVDGGVCEEGAVELLIAFALALSCFASVSPPHMHSGGGFSRLHKGRRRRRPQPLSASAVHARARAASPFHQSGPGLTPRGGTTRAEDHEQLAQTLSAARMTNSGRLPSCLLSPLVCRGLAVACSRESLTTVVRPPSRRAPPETAIPRLPRRRDRNITRACCHGAAPLEPPHALGCSRRAGEPGRGRDLGSVGRALRMRCLNPVPYRLRV